MTTVGSADAVCVSSRGGKKQLDAARMCLWGRCYKGPSGRRTYGVCRSVTVEYGVGVVDVGRRGEGPSREMYDLGAALGNGRGRRGHCRRRE